ncbi:hypothetical protein BGZ61DRAFT_417726 [Ilyonectria robusta]|uniref:uncharacterized protein n=1 Tax=Ilyonectria robusta TaxID=1079257 RepID=UPI001E8E0D27|nr:uncharacterized protein BGZ61DRAFT_417726 [Ilyonectria robusta]KAH8714454.1 hypothetical protein BGZ61DRAFT_417726 [Ilyonectria robusta]
MRYAHQYDELPRGYSKSHAKDRDHRDSRLFDSYSHISKDHRPSHEGRKSHTSRRDTQSHSSRSSQSHSTPSTYGTYIWPLESRGQYKTMDPTKCRCTCCPHPSSISKSQYDRHYHDDPRHSQDRRPPREEFVIKVVDNSRGPLRREHGDRYPLTLSSTSSASSVLSVLAPDGRRAEVVVHWNDGEQERLDEKVPMDDVRRFGKYLEVNEKKKRVHWY